MAVNLLNAIPAIGEIINKVVPDRDKQMELKLELAKIDAQESVSRLKVVGHMLQNKSVFVSGGIPALLWLAVLYIVANYIVFPMLAGLGMNISPIDLPPEYWSLLKVIVVGLFGKKVVDNNEWRWGGKLVSPSKAQTEIAIARGDTVPVGDRYSDPAEVDRRLEEIMREKGL